MSLGDTIQQIDARKAELDALRPINPEYERHIRLQFRLWWTFHSNSIEGNSLTFGETYQLIMHAKSADKPIRDVREIEAHNQLLLELEETHNASEILIESTIREFHKRILGGKPYRTNPVIIDGVETSRLITPGKYKTGSNNVLTNTGEIFPFTSPTDTPFEMQKLIEWVNDNLQSNTLHPLTFASLLHYKFIMIHPFDDGNGRMARILMNIILQHYKYPPVIVKVLGKENYFSALRKADGGDLDAFHEYIGTLLLQSLDINIRGAKGENISERDDIDKEIELTRKILLRERGKEADAVDSLLKQRILIFERSYIPFAKSLDEKLSKFKVDFENWTTSVYVYNLNKSLKGFVDNNFNSTHPGYLFDSTLSFLDTLEELPSSFKYDCRFFGITKLLRSSKDFNIESQLLYSDDEYEIRTTIDGKQVSSIITKPNNEYLTEGEITDAVAEIIRTFLKLMA